MQKPYLNFILLTCLLLMCTGRTVAQTGGFAGSFSRMGFSPRGMAMGNALSAVHQEGSYGYYNPALAAMPSETVQADISTALLRFDRQLHMFTSHFQLPPSAGFSMSLINARVHNIDGRSSSGYHTEMLSVHEYQLAGNFALRLTEAVWGGVAIKYNFANVHEEVPNNNSIGVDGGLRIRLLPSWVISVAVKDLLATLRIDSSGLYSDEAGTASYAFPKRFIAGTSFEISKKWLLGFDFENRFQHSRFTRKNSGNRSATSVSKHLRFGSRYLVHERITLRGGFQITDAGNENLIQPSAGFSIHLPYDPLSPSIDYAFVREPSQISTMHVFSLRLNI